MYLIVGINTHKITYYINIITGRCVPYALEIRVENL